MSEFEYWLLTSAGEPPLVVLADASAGEWVNELVPAAMPATPLQFHLVKEGAFGPVLNAHNVVLFRDDMLSAILAHYTHPLAAYPATIQPPQGGTSRGDYAVVKAPREIAISGLRDSAGAPVLAVVSGARGDLVVSSELRVALEPEGVHGLRFEEPHFAAA